MRIILFVLNWIEFRRRERFLALVRYISSRDFTRPMRWERTYNKLHHALDVGHSVGITRRVLEEHGLAFFESQQLRYTARIRGCEHAMTQGTSSLVAEFEHSYEVCSFYHSHYRILLEKVEEHIKHIKANQMKGYRPYQ